MAGNTAADVRAGGAWYEMYGKDRLTPVIEKAKKAAESLGGAMKKVNARASKGIEDALESIRGTITAGVAAVGVMATQEVIGAIAGLDKLQKVWAKTALVIEQVNTAMDRNRRDRAERIEAVLEPGKRREEIEKEILKLQQEQSEELSARDSLQDRIDRSGVLTGTGSFGERVNNAGGVLSGLVGGASRGEAVEQLQKELDNANANVAKRHEALLDYSKKRGNLINPDLDNEKRKEIEELTRAIRIQADTWGQAADSVTRYELKVKGFSEKQLAAVEGAQKRLKLQETLGGAAAEIFGSSAAKATELKEELKSVTDELKKQADTWNMAAGQIALYDLKAKGFSDSAIAEAKSQVERMGMLSTLGGAIDAIAQGAAAAKSQGPASLGSFSAVAAGQRFGQTDSKKLGDIVDNTAATAKAAEAFVKGFVLK